MARVDTPISYINLAAPLEIRPTRGKSRLNRVERDGERNSTALLLSSSFPVNSIRPNIFPLLPPPKWTRLSLSGVKGDHVSVERVFLLFFSSSLESVLIPSPLFSLRMFLLSIGSYVAEEGPIEFSNWNGISTGSRKGCVGFSRFSGNLLESGGGGFVLGGR